MRMPYLDNLRWAAVLLVVAYHVCYLFNGVGVLGAVPGARSLAAGDALLYAVYPWFMVLLFVIAGICARRALGRRSGRDFLRERTRKLLVPSTIGVVVFQWVTGLLNLASAGAFAYLPSPLVYPVAVLSGIGPLWFAQLLWLYSAVLLGLRRLDPKDRLWKAGARATSLPALLALAVPVWAAAQVGNLPVITVYRFGIYLAAFLLGYYVLSHEEAQAALARAHRPLAAAALGGGAVYVWHFYGQNYAEAACLQSPWTNLYLWVAVLALLGCGQARWNTETALTRRLAHASFGLYVLHYPVVLAACLLLARWAALPTPANYLLALALTLVVTPALAAGIRRVSFLRWAVLGVPRR